MLSLNFHHFPLSLSVPLYSHLLHTHSLAAAKSIPGLHPALHVCFLSTVHHISYIPTKPPESRNDSHFAVGHGFSSLKILEGSIRLSKSHSGSNQRNSVVIFSDFSPAYCNGSWKQF